jgi:predicted  nucleic acid-binding Zn-ribbon protein
VLLDVQELDTRIATLRQRLGKLPAAAALADLESSRAAVDGQARDLRIGVGDLVDEQKRADADVEQVKTRRDRDQGMVDSGSISDPKALERMLGELESLARRISSLEDVELEVMERLETAQSELAQKDAELVELEEQIAAARAQLDKEQSDVSGERDSLSQEREQLASSLPAELLSHYEKLREKKGGVGAAALRRKECLGCGLALNTAELAAIAKAPRDEVLHCDDCGRILVITSESGL